jgi:hypothetical protein
MGVKRALLAALGRFGDSQKLVGQEARPAYQGAIDICHP